MLISKEEKFDFNDILLVPEVYSDIESRYNDINPYVNVIRKDLPLLTAPMDTVVSKDNIKTFIDNGIGVVLPRTIKDIYENDLQYYNVNGVFVSYGLNEFENLLFFEKDSIGRIPKYILIDIANGHLSKIVELCKKAKVLKPDIIIMVGNIANPETYRYYAENDCVDYIRIGIGSGSGCLTSDNGAIGYPMASLIYETYKVKQEFILSNYHNIKNNFL
jgi:GMP reductase